MAVCSFCPLLCEYEPNQSLDCSLRRSTLEQLERLRALPEQASKPDTDGNFASEVNENIIAEAVKWLREAANIKITGRVVSVETSRALLALAEKLDAYVDIVGSNSAFPLIRAVQTAGMTTASLSEIRFRSDVIVIIGDDRLLEAFPRLAERIILPPRARSYREGAQDKGLLASDKECSPIENLSFEKRRIALLGDWSTDSIARFKALNCEVAAIKIDVERIPQSLHEWSQLTEDQRSHSANRISRWISEASYLSLAWSTSLLDFSQPDLWIERLFQWISTRNEAKRCVGFPLALLTSRSNKSVPGLPVSPVEFDSVTERLSITRIFFHSPIPTEMGTVVRTFQILHSTWKLLSMKRSSHRWKIRRRHTESFTSRHIRRITPRSEFTLLPVSRA